MTDEPTLPTFEDVPGEDEPEDATEDVRNDPVEEDEE